jgi:hypothetical protein
MLNESVEESLFSFKMAEKRHLAHASSPSDLSGSSAVYAVSTQDLGRGI